MNRLDHTRKNLKLRKQRIRSHLSGTAERPRLSVRISNRHVSAQIIDDTAGKTLVASTTVNVKTAGQTMSEQCAWLGADIAKKAVKAKISQVAFDRNGRAYQNRLRALADAARQNGLEF